MKVIILVMFVLNVHLWLAHTMREPTKSGDSSLISLTLGRHRSASGCEGPLPSPVVFNSETLDLFQLPQSAAHYFSLPSVTSNGRVHGSFIKALDLDEQQVIRLNAVVSDIARSFRKLELSSSYRKVGPEGESIVIDRLGSSGNALRQEFNTRVNQIVRDIVGPLFSDQASQYFNYFGQHFVEFGFVVEENGKKKLEIKWRDINGNQVSHRSLSFGYRGNPTIAEAFPQYAYLLLAADTFPIME